MSAANKLISIEALQAALDSTPFINFMQIKVTSWPANGEVLELTAPYREEFGGGADVGHVHGGVIGALIDTAASMIFFAQGIENAPTSNYRVDLIRPVVRSSMRAVTRVRRLGKTLAIADVDVFDAADKLVAMGRATMAVR
jgi:uncharacterized protein (TIGR00369 family)